MNVIQNKREECLNGNELDTCGGTVAGIAKSKRELGTSEGWGKKPEALQMEYVKEFVLGKIVGRFKWRDKLSPWKVIAWMPMPEPYKKEGSV